MARAVRVKSPSPSKSKSSPSRARPAPVARKKRSDDKARIAAIIDGLEQLYPEAHCELDFETPFQLLVATILSAQCTDKRVNLVTPTLFAKYGTPEKMAEATPQLIEPIIQSTGFFRNKAKSILGAARVIMEDFAGEVPRTMEELLTLPGVARKTANVVLGSGFGLNEGFVVDTHVMRLAARLKLARADEPVKIEVELCAKIPRDKWTKMGHQLIWHGRRVCFARKPACHQCALAPHCPSVGKV
jgi:endonuclease-3